MTRSSRDKLLTGQTDHDWPNFYRAARFVPAVGYIQANRPRLLAIQGIAKAFENVDIVITPTYSTQWVATNLSGHPALIVPNGFRGADAPPPNERFIQNSRLKRAALSAISSLPSPVGLLHRQSCCIL